MTAKEIEEEYSKLSAPSNGDLEIMILRHLEERIAPLQAELSSCKKKLEIAVNTLERAKYHWHSFEPGEGKGYKCISLAGDIDEALKEIRGEK